jgi:hypothetical protein
MLQIVTRRNRGAGEEGGQGRRRAIGGGWVKAPEDLDGGFGHLPRGLVLSGLRVGVDHVVAGVQFIGRLAGWPAARAEAAEARLVSIEACQSPIRVNVWEGMCKACGVEGAIAPYRLAASVARDARAGSS